MGGCLLTSCTGMVGILTTGVSTGFSPASAEDANELLHLFSFHCQYFHFSCSLWNYVCRHGHPRHHDFTITVNIITIIIVTSFTGYSTNITILNTLTWYYNYITTKGEWFEWWFINILLSVTFSSLLKYSIPCPADINSKDAIVVAIVQHSVYSAGKGVNVCASLVAVGRQQEWGRKQRYILRQSHETCITFFYWTQK